MKNSIFILSFISIISLDTFGQIPLSTSRNKSSVAISPKSTTISTDYLKGYLDIAGATQYATTEAKPHLLIKESGDGYARIRFMNYLDPSANSFWDIRTETFTGGPIPDRYMAFAFGYEDKMFIKEGGNVGIGLSMPSEKLEVAGNIKLSGNIKYTTAQTRYKSFAPTVFHSQRPTTYDFGFPTTTSENYAYFLNGFPSTLGYAVVDVSLPQNATITSLWGAILDNSATSPVRVTLYRLNISTFARETVIEVESTAANASASIQYLTATPIPGYNVVDNSNYAYYLMFTGQQNTDLTRLYSTRISYTVTEEN